MDVLKGGGSVKEEHLLLCKHNRLLAQPHPRLLCLVEAHTHIGRLLQIIAFWHSVDVQILLLSFPTLVVEIQLPLSIILPRRLKEQELILCLQLLSQQLPHLFQEHVLQTLNLVQNFTSLSF